MQDNSIIYVVNTDRDTCRSVERLVHTMQLESKSFTCSEDFLANYAPGRPGVLVAGLLMQGMSGLQLLKHLQNSDCVLPAIILTAHATTAATVCAMAHGALTVLDKPCADCDLWDCITRGLAVYADRCRALDLRTSTRERIASLSAVERQVLNGLVNGKPNKAIANELDVSIRTIENRRRKIYCKLSCKSLAELVRTVVEVDASDSVMLDRVSFGVGSHL